MSIMRLKVNIKNLQTLETISCVKVKRSSLFDQIINFTIHIYTLALELFYPNEDKDRFSKNSNHIVNESLM
jgi:hypothetical protein